MSYRPITHSSPLPPHIERLVWKLERHYLQPAHALFRLPIPNYRVVGEFQFGIAHILIAAIAGISTTLYASSGSNGARFRELLGAYYPFGMEPPNAAPSAEAARTLWSVFRNPLAHDLGFDTEKHAKTAETKLFRVLTKVPSGSRGLSEHMIERLEDCTLRPGKAATVEIRKDATVLSVDILYWGVRCMTENLLGDSVRVSKAEAYLSSL